MAIKWLDQSAWATPPVCWAFIVTVIVSVPWFSCSRLLFAAVFEHVQALCESPPTQPSPRSVCFPFTLVWVACSRVAKLKSQTTLAMLRVTPDPVSLFQMSGNIEWKWGQGESRREIECHCWKVSGWICIRTFYYMCTYIHPGHLHYQIPDLTV